MQTEVLHILYLLFLTIVSADYWSQREYLLTQDSHEILGTNIVLTPKEEQVNEILMNYKIEEFSEGFKNPELFLPQQHFFKSKEKIKNSKVFKFIQQLPKGALLHAHEDSLVSQEYLYNLTFKENLYGCVNGDNLFLRFFPKENISDSCNWTLLSDLRRNDLNFDTFLKSKLSIVRENPDEVYTNVNSVWLNFQQIFNTILGLFTYKPVFKEYFYQVLKELYEDNVKYLEFRTMLPPLYDLEGNIYSEIQILELYQNVLKRFQNDYPDFYGAGLIYSPPRNFENSTLNETIKVYKTVKEAYPELIIGFDLVGQEDLGNPLSSYIPQLLELKASGTNFYFHAGETNWYGETDINLFDAILLNTTRIGHGYALLKHPAIAELVKARNIAIEICPISNQVLKLVSDLQNHPGTIMMANGFPVVIGSDDPSFWNAKGLSYDWYLAFMAMTSKETDIRFLKQLAINSIKYSSLSEYEKTKAMLNWENDWAFFMNSLIVIN